MGQVNKKALKEWEQSTGLRRGMIKVAERIKASNLTVVVASRKQADGQLIMPKLMEHVIPKDTYVELMDIHSLLMRVPHDGFRLQAIIVGQPSDLTQMERSLLQEGLRNNLHYTL